MPPHGRGVATPHAPYDVREVSVAARPVAGVRAQVPRGRVGQVFGRHLDQVYAAARTGALKLDGQNIFIYRAAAADTLTVDFCVGATEPFAPVGPVVPLETPHGVAAMTTHIGDYGRLGEANAAILAWCQANTHPRRAIVGGLRTLECGPRPVAHRGLLPITTSRGRGVSLLAPCACSPPGA